MIETVFIIFSTLLTGSLGLIWKYNNVLNFVIKLALICNAFVGGYIIFTNGLLG